VPARTHNNCKTKKKSLYARKIFSQPDNFWCPRVSQFLCSLMMSQGDRKFLMIQLKRVKENAEALGKSKRMMDDVMMWLWWGAARVVDFVLIWWFDPSLDSVIPQNQLSCAQGGLFARSCVGGSGRIVLVGGVPAVDRDEAREKSISRFGEIGSRWA